MADITIRKGNVELTVPEDQKDRYLKLGYSVYEGNKLVEEAPSNDIGALQAKIARLNSENDKLREDNKSLSKELQKLKVSKTKAVKED